MLAPAIELSGGFPVSPRLAAHLVGDQATIERWPTTAAVFLPSGRPLATGDLLVQADLAAFLRRLVDLERRHLAAGRAAAIIAVRDEVYTGHMAEELLSFLHRVGSGLTAEDLAAAHVTIEPPARGHYRGVDVLACGPWSQGPVLPLTLHLLRARASPKQNTAPPNRST